MADGYEVPHVWALAVESRWIVGDGKQDLQQLGVNDFGRIANHSDAFRISTRFWRSAD